MKHTPRHTATQALLQMEENEGYSNIVIDKALRAAGLDARDAGLASTIFYGVLERRLPLEHFLRGCLANPQKKLDPLVWALLLCAAYQILYLDRVPDSAAVNEAVEEAKGIKGGAFAGLVNGVLRSLARKKSGPLPAPGGQPPGAELALFHPPGTHRPVAALLREGAHRPAAGGLPAPGPAVLANQPPAGHGRGPGRLFGTAGLFPEAGGVPALGGGGRGGEGSPASLEEFQEGLFHVQDLSAQLACSLLEAGPGRLSATAALPRREELHLGRGHGEYRQPARL